MHPKMLTYQSFVPNVAIAGPHPWLVKTVPNPDDLAVVTIVESL